MIKEKNNIIDKTNVFKKLQKARAELTTKVIEKSGKNNFNKFEYFQLEDFLPDLNKICDKVGICDVISLNREKMEASITIYDVEDPLIPVIFSVPLVFADVNKQQEIQNSGATLTYYRRYLYMLAFNITENDIVDDEKTAKKISEENKKQNKPKLASTSEYKQPVKAPAILSKLSKEQVIENIKSTISEDVIERYLQGQKVVTLEEIDVDELNRVWNNYLMSTKN